MASSVPPKFYAEDASIPENITLTPIGVVRSPHKERHGTPRQAVLAADPAHRAHEHTTIELFDAILSPHAVEDLVGFEYIWVIAWLHLNHGWRNKVNVPGEGKTTRRSLLATRAPHRPNPIGLSAVRLHAVHGLTLELERCDLLDGTPVLDIKPYVPYADAFPAAKAGWLDERDATPKR